MRTKRNKVSSTSLESRQNVKTTFLAAALSATIRTVVPVMGLFVVGLAVDFALRQEAFWAIVGAVVGFVVAAFLIFLQIKKLGQRDSGLGLNESESSDAEPISSKRKSQSKPSAKGSKQ
jgi:large-conductance mechanosensitive channel